MIRDSIFRILFGVVKMRVKKFCKRGNVILVNQSTVLFWQMLKRINVVIKHCTKVFFVLSFRKFVHAYDLKLINDTDLC